MKRVIQIGVIWITVILLGGCGMMPNTKQESNGTTLSAEYDALCNSKRTLNKSLCRETMGQLPKFESEINAHFKEKFNIDGFKLTGINFPYTAMQHGGFNATFQLESDPYVMITDTFDYSSDGKYTIRNANTEGEEQKDAGKLLLASAVLISEYLKTLPIAQIEDELEKIGVVTRREDILFTEYSSGQYFKKRNLAMGLINSQERIFVDSNIVNEIVTIKNVNFNRAKEISQNEYRESLIHNVKLFPMMVVESDEDAKQKFDAITQLQEKINKELFLNRSIYFIEYPAKYKVILNENGEVKING